MQSNRFCGIECELIPKYNKRSIILAKNNYSWEKRQKELAKKKKKEDKKLRKQNKKEEDTIEIKEDPLQNEQE